MLFQQFTVGTGIGFPSIGGPILLKALVPILRRVDTGLCVHPFLPRFRCLKKQLLHQAHKCRSAADPKE